MSFLIFFPILHDKDMDYFLFSGKFLGKNFLFDRKNFLSFACLALNTDFKGPSNHECCLKTAWEVWHFSMYRGDSRKGCRADMRCGGLSDSYVNAWTSHAHRLE